MNEKNIEKEILYKRNEPSDKKKSPEVERSEALDNFIEEFVAKEYTEKERAPLDKKGRIDPNFFSEVYSKEIIERDKKIVEQHKKEYYGDKLAAVGIESGGEELEALTTVIFRKFLGSDFVVVRSSEYDDEINHVDNVILDKVTGNIVGAFDETEKTSGEKLRDKMEMVMDRNRKGGTSLKYGMIYEQGVSGEKREAKTELKLKEIRNIPLFLIKVPEATVEEAIKNFVPSLKESSINERHIFKQITQSLKQQAESQFYKSIPNLVFQKRLAVFQKFLGNLDFQE